MIKDQRWYLSWYSGTGYENRSPHVDATSAVVGGGGGGRKYPNGLTLGSAGLSLSCMDLVDPGRDFLLALNESAQSWSQPVSRPRPRQTNSGRLRGERSPSSLHNRRYCYYYFIFSAIVGCWGMPKTAIPRKTSSKIEIRRKNFPESTIPQIPMLQEWRLSRNAPMRCAVSLCSRTSSLHYQNILKASVLFWDEQSDIFGKVRRSRTDISRDFVWVTAVQQMLPIQDVAVQSERLVGNLRW